MNDHLLWLRSSRRVVRAVGAVGLMSTALFAACAGDGSEVLTPREPDDVEEPPEPPPVVPGETGIEVTHITLTSHRAPAVHAPPTVTGWPAVNEPATWVAHVFNRGPDSVEAVPFAWSVDGASAATGIADLAVGETGVEIVLPWAAERQRLSFEVFLPDGITDPDSTDNATAVFTNALAVGFWVEQGVYDWMLERAGPPAFERWARSEVDAWNTLLESFESELVPEGVIDRVRLDRVEVIPSGARWPPLTDVDTDLAWSVQDHHPDSRFLQRHSSARVYGDQAIILHELIHQRGVSDIYAYEIHDRAETGRIGIRDPDGLPAAGRERLPWVIGRDLYNPPFERVLMGTALVRHAALSPLTVYGLNAVAGRRATRRVDDNGNVVFDMWDDVNVYLKDLPDSIVFLVRDPAGAIVADAALDVFPNLGTHDYEDRFAPTAALTTRIDGDGRTTAVPTTLVDTTPASDLARGFPVTAILRVRHGSEWGYAFLPLHDLNLEFIRGNRGTVEYSIAVALR